MFQFALSRRRTQSCTEKTSPNYRIKESVKFGWEMIGTAKPYGPSTDGRWWMDLCGKTL